MNRLFLGAFCVLLGCAEDPSLTFGPIPARYDAGPPDAATYCSSGRSWTSDDDDDDTDEHGPFHAEGDEEMLPGQACTQCHDLSGEDDAPHFTVAGTVYPMLHEPDDCISEVGAAVQIEIDDAAGQHLVLIPNAVGNFFTEVPIALPYRARVVSGTRARTMTTPQRAGDCNACHTALGRNDAPGRVVSP